MFSGIQQDLKKYLDFHNQAMTFVRGIVIFMLLILDLCFSSVN